MVTTVAGAFGSTGSTDDVGSAASFSYPTGVAADLSGNVYVADCSNNKIRKIWVDGSVTTWAGTGSTGATDGTGNMASFSYPSGVAVDSAGNVFVADEGNNKIRKIAQAPPQNPMITWVAPKSITYGTALSSVQLNAAADVPGTFVYSPADGAVLGPGTQTLTATFTPIDSVNFAAVTVTTTMTVNQVIPAIVWAAPAAITCGTALSSTQLDATADVPGTFVYSPAIGTVPALGSQILSVTFTPDDTTDCTTATAKQTLLVNPVAPTADPAAAVIASGFDATWAAVTGATGYYVDVSTGSSFDSFVAGYENLDVGNVTQIDLVGLDPGTTYYYRVRAYDGVSTGTNSGTITVTTPAAIVIKAPLTVSTLAGQALSYGFVDGTGTAARFCYPSGVAVDSSGNVYVADTDNNAIRKIVASTGAVSTLAGGLQTALGADAISEGFARPSGVAVDGSGNVYVADTLNNMIRKVTSAGVVSTIAGQAGVAGSADGTGTAALFQGPQGLAIDPSGEALYIADTNNQTVRKMVLSSGEVSTIAGLAGTSGSADGTGSSALFNGPFGVAVDSSGNVYVADADNNTIRKVTSSGVVTTIAGLAGSSGGADGTGGTATFDSPSALTIDSSGKLYVADTGNFTIRVVVPSTGVVSTLAGVAGTSGSSDGLGSAALFFQPAGIAADNNGDLYIADTDNHTIRLGVLAATPMITSQPQSQTVTAGGSAQFSVTTTGQPAVSYQWYLGTTAISGAKSSTYNLSDVQSGNAGNYTVVVSNVIGSVTSNVARSRSMPRAVEALDQTAVVAVVHPASRFAVRCSSLWQDDYVNGGRNRRPDFRSTAMAKPTD